MLNWHNAVLSMFGVTFKRFHLLKFSYVIKITAWMWYSLY